MGQRHGLFLPTDLAHETTYVHLVVFRYEGSNAVFSTWQGVGRNSEAYYAVCLIGIMQHSLIAIFHNSFGISFFSNTSLNRNRHCCYAREKSNYSGDQRAIQQI